MSFNEVELRNEIQKIKNNAYDVKKHFSYLYSTVLGNTTPPDFFASPNVMVEEETLDEHLAKDYPNQQYVLLFYAHKPHADYRSPVFPDEPRSHTSILLCKIKANKIDQIVNIDGYHSLNYIDILGERKGANRHPNIKESLIIKAQQDTSENAPLQAPSWYNMNCTIYALTFAKKIMDIFSKKPALIDNIFPEDKLVKAPPQAMFELEQEILGGMVGTYVTKSKGRFISDKTLRDKHHKQTRENLANEYELQHRSKPIIPVDTKTEEANPSVTATSSAFFHPSPSNPTKPVPQNESRLSLTQIADITKLIHQLEGEINSCWPYPHKDRKQIKVNALNTLLTNAKSMDVLSAVESIDTLPGVREGHLSTRTSDLLDSLKNMAKRPGV